MESSNELPDSTDWIPTSLPAFEPLEAALRCEVCKEFYNNPVITSCSHTFCSLCIRRCIGADGKCPTCKSACQADKLLPNIAVREVAVKFQEARVAALELARKDKNEAEAAGSGKKRKLEDTDIEEEPLRQTRARQTRRSARQGNDVDNTPVVIPDSEEERDDEYLPEGMANCPICNKTMKVVLVYDHVGTCGQEDASSHSTRSRKSAFPAALQTRKKDPIPPATRLSGLNYAMLTETALRKKLKELGIPNWGTKTLMIRRHQEWLNIYNSNCDASDSVRKSKRELLKELDEWERTQGGNANLKESHIMRKDWDGQSHASVHKSQFDDLIANARKKVKAKQTGDRKEAEQPDKLAQQDENHAFATLSEKQPVAQPPEDPSQPYANNEEALSSVRAKVQEANGADSAFPPLSRENLSMNGMSPSLETLAATRSSGVDEQSLGLQPLSSPSKKTPMFRVPEEPVCDVESSTAVQYAAT